mgnify:CR=1 FL=1
MTDVMDMTKLTLGELADAYRDAWDAQEDAQRVADEHASRRHQLREEILRRMESQELEQFKTDRITLTMKEEFVPKVSDWGKVFSWITGTNRWELLRKQLNTGAFKELVDSGEPLPPEIEATLVKSLNNRRK